MRGSAIHKTQVPRSKVKVTIQGQKVKFCPFDMGACPEHNFVCYGWIFKSLGRNVKHAQTVCRAQEPCWSAKGQGHSLRSHFQYWLLLVRSITLLMIEGFSNNLVEMLTLMRRSVAHKTQVCRSKVKVTFQGQSFQYYPFIYYFCPDPISVQY